MTEEHSSKTDLTPPGAEADNVVRSEESPFASPDTRFRSYVTFYSTLDNLIWRNVATALAIIGLGSAAIGAAIEKRLAAPFLNGNNTTAIICFATAILVLLVVYTIRRMRFHHELMETELRKLEPAGYFHERLSSTRHKWRSAPQWTQIVLASTAFGFVALGISFLRENAMEETSVSSERANLDFGIFTKHSIMPNGELRFRLMGADGNGYIRTMASREGAWQKSHSHSHFSELYIVESGWMAIAVPDENKTPKWKLYYPGQTYRTELGQPHNVYLSAGAVLHTVKFGVVNSQSDWRPDLDFDAKTKIISEDILLSRNK